MCVPSPEHTLRTLSTNRRGEGEAPPPAPSTYTPRRTRPAPARLTPGPYASVSAGGGGEKEARGRREEKTGGGKSREEGRGGGGGCSGCGGGAGAEGRGSCARAAAGGRGLRCVELVGGGEGWLASGSERSRVGRPLLPHTPPPPPPWRSVNPSPRRWAARGASGFLGANHPPRARPSGPLPATACPAPLAPVP